MFSLSSFSRRHVYLFSRLGIVSKYKARSYSLRFEETETIEKSFAKVSKFSFSLPSFSLKESWKTFKRFYKINILLCAAAGAFELAREEIREAPLYKNESSKQRLVEISTKVVLGGIFGSLVGIAAPFSLPTLCIVLLKKKGTSPRIKKENEEL